MKKLRNKFKELEKRTAALEGSVQEQPQKIVIKIDGKCLAEAICNYSKTHH